VVVPQGVQVQILLTAPFFLRKMKNPSIGAIPKKPQPQLERKKIAKSNALGPPAQKHVKP
jgi:hypothetical protein